MAEKIIGDIPSLYGDFLNPKRLAETYNGSSKDLDVMQQLIEIMLHRDEKSSNTYPSVFDTTIKNEVDGNNSVFEGMLTQINTKYGKDKAQNKIKDVIAIFGQSYEGGTFDSYLGPVFSNPDPFGSGKKIADNVDIIKILDVQGKVLDETKKDFAILLSNSTFISPAMNEAADVAAFFNGIPSVHLARCMPFLQVELKFNRKMIQENLGILQAPSVLKFLLGAVTPPRAVDKYIFDSSNRVTKKTVPNGPEGKTEDVIEFSAGMEIFTTPATLLPEPTKNLNTSTASRFVDYRDRFVPMASITNVSISERPSGFGNMTYPSAKLEMKVHDRTRLAEMSDFLRAEYLSATEVRLTYGFKYPTATGQENEYEKFINKKLQVTKIFRLSNMSYSFTEDNGVKINLELYTPEAEFLAQLNILDGSPIGSRVKELIKIRQEIGKIFAKIRETITNKFTTEEVRKLSYLDDLNGRSFKSITPEALTALREIRDEFTTGDNRINLGRFSDRLKNFLEKYNPTPKPGNEENETQEQPAADGAQKPANKPSPTEPNAKKEPDESKSDPQAAFITQLTQYIYDKIWHRNSDEIRKTLTPPPSPAPPPEQPPPQQQQGQQGQQQQQQPPPSQQQVKIKVRATNYYPYSKTIGNDKKKRLMEGPPHDRTGRPLNTLQMFLAGKADYVSVAGDFTVFPDGQLIQIPDMDKRFNSGKQINFRVVDTGGHFYDGGRGHKVIREAGFEPLDICTDEPGDLKGMRNTHEAIVFVGEDFGGKRTRSGTRKFNPSRMTPGSYNGDDAAAVATNPNTPQASGPQPTDAQSTAPSNTSSGGDIAPRYDVFLALYQTKQKEVLKAVKSGLTRSGDDEAARSVDDTAFSLEKNGEWSKFASFGYLFTTFLCPPLLQLNDQANELQIFFYPFNDKAGAVRGMNIAEFPIHIEDFASRWALSIAGTTNEDVMGTTNLRAFVDTAIMPAIHDQYSPAYGNYMGYVNKDNALKRADEVEPESDASKRLQKQKDAINSVFGTRIIPKIEVYVETLPGPAKNISRIHVYDAAANAFPNVTQLVSSEKNGSLVGVDDNSKINQIIKDEMKRRRRLEQSQPVEDETIVSQAERDGAIKETKIAAFNSQALKDYVARTMPYIKYGTSNSVIKNATVQSNASSELSSIQITRARFGTNPTDPNNAGSGGFPLRVIPSQLSMTTLGCPLLRAAQRFFVDFNTGTTIDNVYMIRELTHNITPGSFTTQLSAVFDDGYPQMSSEGEFLAQLDQMRKDIDKQLEAEKSSAEAQRGENEVDLAVFGATTAGNP